MREMCDPVFRDLSRSMGVVESGPVSRRCYPVGHTNIDVILIVPDGPVLYAIE